MSVLRKLKTKETWDNFLAHVEGNIITVDKRLVKKIKRIIDNGVENITFDFPMPTKSEISKYKNQKKRTVYSFGEPYNTYMKCINFALQDDVRYTDKFCINSIAYQKGKSIRRYVHALKDQIVLNRRRYFIKTDFTNYFNSIDLDILIEKMESFFLEEDRDLFILFRSILSNPNVIVKDEIVQIWKKGVMAGLPISGYLANVYMNDVDWEMYKRHIYYTRYADDVLILTNNIGRDEVLFNSLIEPLKLKLNPTKVETGKMKDGVTFLGFHVTGHTITINRRAINKMKRRIKRRSKWFQTWRIRKNVTRRTTAKTFIEGMNRKFYTRISEDGTCWIEWYAKSINTDIALREIDTYMCQYIRYLLSGKQKGYKKHAKIKYSTLKTLGFKPLVNEFWKIKKELAKK